MHLCGWLCQWMVRVWWRHRSANSSSFVLEYTAECTVSESSANASLSGNCDIDVDECASVPCQQPIDAYRYDATCLASPNTAWMAADYYECRCSPGFDGANCEIDIDECESNPVRKWCVMQGQFLRSPCNVRVRRALWAEHWPR